MPLLAIVRKDTGGKSIGTNGPAAANPVSKRLQYGGIVAGRGSTVHKVESAVPALDPEEGRYCEKVHALTTA